MASEPKLSLRALVRGRVQGVGFRWFVKQEAQRLDLVGWVRNLPEGGVELEAQGPREALESLLSALEGGPSGSRVDSVDPEWVAGVRPMKGFAIRG